MKRILVFVFMALMLVILMGCASNSVVQVNTPVPSPKSGTPGADTGQINVPGASIQVYAPGPNPLVGTADAHGHPAGFWLGLWHGIISPVTLIASFVSKQNVQMYEVHNDGSLYNLGFFLGILIFPAVLGLIFGSRR